MWLEAQEGLDQKSITLDPLTKLPTRVEFLSVLEERIEHYKNEASPFILMLISLDAHKSLVESTGNEDVEQMVIKVADIIKHETNSTDDSIARYDAATFAVILGYSTIDAAETTAQHICENVLNQKIISNNESIISIGLAEYPTQLTCGDDENCQEQIKSILQSTDNAVKQAQKHEKNGFYCDQAIVPS
ncbi:MAG: GGDEF domain-containing protein [Methylococcaceae bacterium]|nr:GGDEF domain-containing protein [Methylococcaceae bacterium]